ncbi:hypothetical protein ALI22I_02570 [Saccharothrix sp. ALI-22-I]|nr:hypothetical protein ALI22I_02570 [Saccharothrix sp. ALI-22-I]
MVDPEQLDREARELFRQLTPASVAGRDQHDRAVTVAPAERLVEITRRARFIAVSDTLARAVVALLGRQGITAEIGHVQVDPAAEGDEQVMGLLVDLHGARAVVPVRPGSTRLRAYPETGDIDLAGSEPLLVLALSDNAVEQDGWVTADSIGTVLVEHLSASAQPAGKSLAETA